MSILNRFKHLVSPVCKFRVFLEQTGVFRRVCSVPEAGCHSLCLPRYYRADLASWRVSTYYFDSKRWHSELHSESSNSKKRTGPIEEESHEKESDVSDDIAQLSESELDVDAEMINRFIHRSVNTKDLMVPTR